jgi:hypothetical protein
MNLIMQRTRLALMVAVSAASLAACSGKTSAPTGLALVNLDGQTNIDSIDMIEFVLTERDSGRVIAVIDSPAHEIADMRWEAKASSTLPIYTEIIGQGFGYHDGGWNSDLQKENWIKVAQSLSQEQGTGGPGSETDFLFTLVLLDDGGGNNFGNGSLTAITDTPPVINSVTLGNYPGPGKNDIQINATDADQGDYAHVYVGLISGDVTILSQPDDGDVLWVPGNDYVFQFNSAQEAIFAIIAVDKYGLCTFETYAGKADPEWVQTDSGYCYAEFDVKNQVRIAALQTRNKVFILSDRAHDDDPTARNDRATPLTLAVLGTADEPARLISFNSREWLPDQLGMDPGVLGNDPGGTNQDVTGIDPTQPITNYWQGRIDLGNGCIEDMEWNDESFPIQLIEEFTEKSATCNTSFTHTKTLTTDFDTMAAYTSYSAVKFGANLNGLTNAYLWDANSKVLTLPVDMRSDMGIGQVAGELLLPAGISPKARYNLVLNEVGYYNAIGGNSSGISLTPTLNEVKVDSENNLLAVRGQDFAAIKGPTDALIMPDNAIATYYSNNLAETNLAINDDYSTEGFSANIDTSSITYGESYTVTFGYDNTAPCNRATTTFCVSDPSPDGDQCVDPNLLYSTAKRLQFDMNGNFALEGDYRKGQPELQIITLENSKLVPTLDSWNSDIIGGTIAAESRDQLKDNSVMCIGLSINGYKTNNLVLAQRVSEVIHN